MKVLVTGASSGIGRDMAKEFAKKGYELVLVARSEDKLRELQSELNSELNTKSTIIIKDLSLPENCKDLYEEAKDIDILVNNAGFGEFGDFCESNLDKELNMINTNITAVHILTKLYLKDMCKKNNGKILNVASIAGAMPGPLMASYYASKAYVVRLTEAIREELNKKNSKVQVSVLMPGPVKTNFNNVAGVRFQANYLTSEYVARYTVNKFLKGKFYIVPGFSIKCTKFFAKVAPNRLLAKCAYYMQKRKV